MEYVLIAVALLGGDEAPRVASIAWRMSESVCNEWPVSDAEMNALESELGGAVTLHCVES